MIFVTGALGFIGSCIAKELNKRGFADIILVDEAKDEFSSKYVKTLKFSKYYEKNKFLNDLKNGAIKPEIIIHMGACSATTETDEKYLIETNLKYSKIIFDWCVKNDSRMIYASSAATYGDGTQGYEDDESSMAELEPLNMYGTTKKLFDDYVISSSEKPRQWVGLKFFNVYGPNEYHKGNMASVVFHSFNQIKKDGKVKLFKSYKKGYDDGGQKRDFIYVKDVVSVVMFFLENPDKKGIFNVGTGKARTFKDLAEATFNALVLQPNIEYIEMPETLKEKYQYFTEANMEKLRNSGYEKEFYSLENGAKDYVKNYLDRGLSNYD